jgi:cephalosporin hydroxylase
VTLAERYSEVANTPSDIVGHLPMFVQMVARLEAKHVIELGTRSGVSTVAWLYALEQTGGHLTSIDLDPRPDIGEWEHWTFIQGDDLDARIVGGLAQADIVFIDTSHLFEHTRAELGVYRWLVRRGGLIVCHDTQLERPEGAPARPRFPVRTAIEEFCAEEGFRWTEHPGSWGLGVIEL